MIRARRSKKIREKSKSIRWQKKGREEFYGSDGERAALRSSRTEPYGCGMFPRCRGIHRSGQDSAGSRRV